MTPADKRVMDLLERWLASIELHLKYADLDETRYRQVQPWPVHERPARWILEVAQQKVLQLQTLCKARLAQNDPAFSESLELMCFLANLVGAQHIQRFIPLADLSRENQAALEATVAAPIKVDAPAATKPAATAAPKTTSRDTSESDRTREMPRLAVAKRSTQAPAAPKPEPATRKTTNKPAPKAAEPAKATGSRMNELIVADAVRLLRWGRQWHELADLIARIAERPASAEIRRILRSHKASIEAQLS